MNLRGFLVIGVIAFLLLVGMLYSGMFMHGNR